MPGQCHTVQLPHRTVAGAHSLPYETKPQRHDSDAVDHTVTGCGGSHRRTRTYRRQRPASAPPLRRCIGLRTQCEVNQPHSAGLDRMAIVRRRLLSSSAVNRALTGAQARLQQCSTDAEGRTGAHGTQQWLRSAAQSTAWRCAAVPETNFACIGRVSMPPGCTDPGGCSLRGNKHTRRPFWTRSAVRVRVRRQPARAACPRSMP